MSKKRPEGHDTVISKDPCPKCGSKDNNVLYGDGHRHCFSPGCDFYAPPSEGGTPRPSTPSSQSGFRSAALLDPSGHPGAFAGSEPRGLTGETFRKFGVFNAGFKGNKAQVYPYYSMDGDMVGQKLRLPNKEFLFLKADGAPPVGECQLFGRHAFGDRYDRQVVVTEGELDALSVAQATNFKMAVVSVNAGAGNAAKNLKTNYLWLDRFQEIVLWFDDDEPGREAAEECAKLFAVGKVRIAKAGRGLKDASDILKAGTPGDIQTALYAAQAWRPKGIVNAADMADDVRAPREKSQAYSYPTSMPLLQEMSGGLHLGEVTFHVAGTGVGKSTQLREIAFDLTYRQGVKVGMLSFEDTRRDAQLLLMSIHANERLQLIPLPNPEEDDFERLAAAYDKKMLGLHSSVFGTRRFELFDAETAEWSLDALLGYVRYMAKALDCKVIIIDPLSFVAALLDANADERKALDMIAAKLAQAAKELHINIQVSHHLRRTSGIPHEEGAPTSINEIRSSGGLANFASFVVGWERNNQADGDAWRVTQARGLKPHRMVGKSGLADVLYYGENGRLSTSHIPFPPVGKPNGDEERPSGGFAPVSASSDY